MPTFTLPKTSDPALPAIGGLGYVGAYDTSNNVTVAASQWFKNAAGVWIPVSATDPLPTAETSTIQAIIAAVVTGVKTVTATAAEIFAGASAKASRRKLILKNEDLVLRFRVGPSTVTQQNGFPVEPGGVVEFLFDPAVAVPIYVISEGANLQVAVMEV